MDHLNSKVKAANPGHQPAGYAVATTDAALVRLKNIPDLAASGIEIVELGRESPDADWSEEDRRIMEILPLAEKELDDMIARFDRAAEISRRSTARLSAARKAMQAAADALRETFARSGSHQ